MGGVKITAIGLAVLGVALASQQKADGQESAPVVNLHQPISLVSYDGAEDASDVGMPSATPAPTRQSSEPSDESPAFLRIQFKGSKGRFTDAGYGAQLGSTIFEPPNPDATIGLSDELLSYTSGDSACDCDDGCLGRRCQAKSTCCGAGCGGTCGVGCLSLCRCRGFWLRSDALLWWPKEDQMPALVTGSPLGTPIDEAGVLGLPTTSDLFSGPIYDDLRIGGRLRFGWWGPCFKYGLEGSVWGVENETSEVGWASAGDPAYARPFFNVDPLVDAPDAELVSFDATLDGAVTINSSSEILGGDLGLRSTLCCSTRRRVDLVAGYRYFKVREGIRITENLESIALTGPTVLGTTIDLFDDFRTRNEFHGGSLGIVAARRWGRWTTEVSPRVAFGQIRRQVAISGQTTVTVPGFAPVTRAGGLLAQPTNIGNYDDREFAVLSEVRADLGYNLTRNLKFLIGYTFMYLGEVTRPGDVIDPTVNGLQLDPTLPLAGPARPQFTWDDSDMWLMGLNLGVDLAF